MSDNVKTTRNTIEEFNKMLAHGDIVQCPECGSYNAYSFYDTTIDSNTGNRFLASDGLVDGGFPYSDDELLTNWPDVHYISSASGFEWECGNKKCRKHFVEIDSPLNQPCYTHSED